MSVESDKEFEDKCHQALKRLLEKVRDDLPMTHYEKLWLVVELVSTNDYVIRPVFEEVFGVNRELDDSKTHDVIDKVTGQPVWCMTNVPFQEGK